MYKRSTVLAAVMVLSLASLAAADTGDRYHKAGLSCANMKLSICPYGDFEDIRKGCGQRNDYIWIQALDAESDPMVGIPTTDYWFGACDHAQQLYICAGAIVADSVTGRNGRTTFSGAIRAGGCVASGGIWISIQGIIVTDPPNSLHPLCLSVIIKSPDLTGPSGMPDGMVNLSDLVPFGSSYNTAWGVSPPPGKAYNPCCDYTDDNLCNLSDFVYFGLHYQHSCF
jgi:hypothetical protein